MRNRLLAIFLIAGIVGIVYIVILFSRPVENNLPAIEAVPASAAILIKANGLLPFLSMLNENSIWKNIQQNETKKNVETLIPALDSLSNETSFFSDLLNDSSICLSIHPNVNENLNILIYLPIGQHYNISKITGAVINIGNRYGLSFSEYKSENLKTQKASWYFFIYKGLLVMGNNNITVSSSFNQVQKKISLLSDTCFAKVFNTSGKNVSGNLYINFQRLPAFLNDLLTLKGIKNFRKLISPSGWSALDINIDSKSIAFQGFSMAKPGGELWMDIFSNEQPAESDFYNTIPSNAILYEALTMNDPYNLRLALNKKLKTDKTFSAKIREQRKIFGFDVDIKLSEINGPSIFLVITGSTENNRFCVIQTQDNLSALDFVKKLLEPNKEKSDTSKLNTSFITKLPGKNLIRTILGNQFERTEYNFVGNYKNAIIFGSSEESLRRYIRDIANDKNLSSDSSFIKLASEQIASKSNISIYSRTNSLKIILDESLKTNSNGFINSFLNSLNNKNVFGLQLSANGQFTYNSGFIYSSENNTSSNEIKWSANLDTSCRYMQTILTLKHECNFLVQDYHNNLYFISGNGRIIWKKKLNDSILGKIYIIDFYKNNKKQFIFNSADKLYLLDKNGNSLKGFPLKFSLRATSGITVTDFDNNLNYRVYVAFEDNTVVALSKEGKKVKGWKFNKSKNKVTLPIQCFTFKGKDFIAFNDSNSIYVLDRKGENRINLKRKVQSCKRFYIDLKANYFKIIFIGQNEDIHVIYPDGHIEDLEFSKGPEMIMSNLIDADKDGNSDYFFADSFNIKTFSQKNKLLFSIVQPTAIDYNQINICKIREELLLLVFSPTEQLIYLKDLTGKNVKGYPIHGNYPVNFLSLSENSYMSSILCSQDSKITFYSIQ